MQEQRMAAVMQITDQRDETRNLRNQCRRRRPCDAHARERPAAEDQQRIQHDVERDREQQEPERRLRVAGAARSTIITNVYENRNGIPRKMMRRYATANGIASSGVCMNVRSGAVKIAPVDAMAIEPTTKKAAPLPTTRLACSRLRAPTLWPMRIAEAMPTPNTSAMRKKRIVLAFDVAVS